MASRGPDRHRADVLVQSRRDKQAAKRLLRVLLKKQMRPPRVHDHREACQLWRSKREVMPDIEHRQHKGLNNRAEHSHRPMPDERRQMKQFKSAGQVRLAGYEDVNDADRLCRDPVVRWVVGDRAINGFAASASQMGRFETKWLSRPENLAALADLPGQWIDKVHQRRPPRTIVLDMDSSKSPTYGEQEGSAYNGHFGCTCYHPLFVFNQLGDVERCALRPGNVHSADGWRVVLEPVIARYRGTVKRRYFRGDAAFANPEMYEFLEAEGLKYVIRLPANSVLQSRIGYLLKCPVGRPPHEVRRHFA